VRKRTSKSLGRMSLSPSREELIHHHVRATIETGRARGTAPLSDSPYDAMSPTGYRNGAKRGR